VMTYANSLSTCASLDIPSTGERPCLQLSERMLAAVKLEARMAGAESTPLVTAER
jgi:hypothetical protein